MKRVILVVFTIFCGLQVTGQEDPVIMTINGQSITKSEFLQIYLKNNDNPKYDKESLDEYMELFRKFKLKVAEAEALGYDTIPKLVKELNGYKKQLALPYLIDSAQNETLVKEAYERTKTEVRASHIMLKTPKTSTPQDSAILYDRLLTMKKRIESGEDFASVAKGPGGSEDPSAANNGGDLGYFTAFQMVYPFEQKAYQTEVGKVSDPFKTRFGYHILMVTDKRPSRGTIETSHIMVSVDKNAENGEENAKSKIDEIYQLLESGESFEELVTKYSDDPSTNKKGGVLPAFGTGTTTRMVPLFEETAFSLEKDGDYSKPIRTNYGYHIVKRIKLTPVPSFEELKDNLENRVAKDVRSKVTQKSFVIKLKDEYGFKDKSKKGLNWFYQNIDSTYFVGKFDASVVPTDKPLFYLDGIAYTQKQFATYIKTNFRGTQKYSLEQLVDIQYRNWINEEVLIYEESKLATKYPAYKALVTEYHDGILLYEIMSDMVWNKAMKDTIGLKAYFEENKLNYQWGERIDADVYEVYSKENAKKTHELLQNDTIKPSDVITVINGQSELNLRHRTGKFDKTRTTHLSTIQLKEGLNEPYQSDEKFYVVNVRELLAPGQKEFSEAKGAITSDYQTHLEKEWLKELESKHKVVINKDALYEIGN